MCWYVIPVMKSREQLMEAADTYVDLATITSHIKRIRRKFQQLDYLDSTPSRPYMVQAIAG